MATRVNSREDVVAWSVDELSDFLLERVGEHIVLKFREQKICGVDFINLTSCQLREAFPNMPLGDKLKIIRLVQEVNSHSAEVSLLNKGPKSIVRCFLL